MGVEADSLVDDPPAGWIVGTVEPAIEQLLALREAGVSRVLCQHYVHEDLDAVELLGELASRVA
jgi:alkanesulfonate monooxygenase SsuD/methylene tetrahydromethanopterin reductase-like flavin-dependent oxidoreductase (luciferase family)